MADKASPVAPLESRRLAAVLTHPTGGIMSATPDTADPPETAEAKAHFWREHLDAQMRKVRIRRWWP